MPLTARWPRIIVRLFAITALAVSVKAAEKPDAIDQTVAPYFRPFQNELATISPDGRHVAMTENGRNAAISVVSIDDREAKRYVIGDHRDEGVQQLQWVSATRLVFTTRSRAVAVIDLGDEEIKPMLLSRDLDAYRPKPILGQRREQRIVTADMAADPSSSIITEPRMSEKTHTIEEALAEAGSSGDLFDAKADIGGGRRLHPFLLGAKPDAPDIVLVEIRTEDLLAFRRGDHRDLTLPGNYYVSDSPGGVPPDSSNGEIQPINGYASYRVDYVPPPLVVLEVDTKKRRTREVANDETWRRAWPDQQGRLRLVLDQRGSTYRYLYRAADASKWVTLDSFAKTPASLGFNIAPEGLLRPRSVPLGFDAEGKNLFFASNVNHDTFTLRSIDLVTGQLSEFELNSAQFDVIEPTAVSADMVLRFDPKSRKLAGVRFSSALRRTFWIDPEIAGLQAGLSKKLSPQHADVLEWDANRTRFLIEVSGDDNPGEFLVYDSVAKKLIRCGERAPWLTEEMRNPARAFEIVGNGGRHVSGHLTLPRKPRVTPAPVLIYFHDGPWFSDAPDFNRGAQAFAALGFAVLQLNHRGSSGLGRSHLTAISGGLDRAVLDDVQTALAGLTKGNVPVNPRLVAALGNGVGGYLAVRMAQLAPETFRCAVAINAPGDLDAWIGSGDVAPTLMTLVRRDYFGADRASLRAQSATAAGAAMKTPVLVVHAADDAYVPIALGRALYNAVKAGSPQTAFLELPREGHTGWSPATTAKLFAELGRFFNATVYKTGVEIGKPKVVP
jgi:dipeptidyl aminopeptidase/acylaminoacyl peptidase